MRYLLTCLAFFLCSLAHAQFQQWDWVQFGTSYLAGYDHSTLNHLPQGTSVAIDAAKNVYVLGTFYDSTRIDTAQLYGDENMFLAKYDAGGHLLWLRSLTRALDATYVNSYGAAIAVDGDGNSYIGGNFRDSIMLGGIKLFSASSGLDDIFLAKYDANGDVVWAKRAGGSGRDVIAYGTSSGQQGSGMKLDDKGFLYFTGEFGGGISMGPASADFDTIHLTDNSNYDHGFLAKYDTAGHVLWAKEIATGAGVISFDVAVDKNENVFVAGLLEGDSVYFDNIKTQIPHVRTAYCNTFLAKYDGSGQALWAKLAGGNGGTSIASLATDSYGNIIVTGDNFNDSATFDGLKLYSNHKIDNTFIAKYTNSGNVIWVKNMAVDYLSDNYPNYMTIDSNNKVYITGVFETTLTAEQNVITSKGGYDIYAARYDADGNLEWLTSFGGSLDDAAFGMYADNGTLYLTGNVLDTCTFGTYTTTGSNANMFVGKLSLPTTAIKQVSIPGNNINIYPNPTSSDITIDLGDASFTQILVSDALGRRISAIPLLGKQMVTISATGFVDGLYFVTISGANGSVSKKFIVQH